MKKTLKGFVIVRKDEDVLMGINDKGEPFAAFYLCDNIHHLTNVTFFSSEVAVNYIVNHFNSVKKQKIIITIKTEDVE